jgi:hypothetical protein
VVVAAKRAGPAAAKAAAPVPNFSKFLWNIAASFAACASYAALSAQVSRVCRTESGTPGTAVGTASPNSGSTTVGTSSSAPASTARTMARVCGSFCRVPVP